MSAKSGHERYRRCLIPCGEHRGMTGVFRSRRRSQRRQEDLVVAACCHQPFIASSWDGASVPRCTPLGRLVRATSRGGRFVSPSHTLSLRAGNAACGLRGDLRELARAQFDFACHAFGLLARRGQHLLGPPLPLLDRLLDRAHHVRVSRSPKESGTDRSGSAWTGQPSAVL